MIVTGAVRSAPADPARAMRASVATLGHVSTVDLSAPFTRNLGSLERAGSDLSLRLTWPVLDSHLSRSASGQLLRKGMPMSLPPSQLRATLAGFPSDGPLAVLGLGDAELVQALLRERDQPLIAWDRDPFLMRAALIAHDLSDAIESGHLELALGADLVELLGREPAPYFVWHPLARASYTLEAELVACGLRGPRVALGVDQLLCEELAAALRAEGRSVVPIDLSGWSLEELELALRRCDPECVASINYVWGLAEFCLAHGVRYLCWEIDPSTERMPRVTSATEHCAVFSYRRAHVATFRDAGFVHVEHLPLAADPERRRPVELAHEERERFGSCVAFVGSSLAPEAKRARRRFDQLFASWHPDGDAALGAAHDALERALAVQRADFSHYILDRELEQAFPEFLAALRARGEREDPIALAAQIAATEKRLAYLRTLAESGSADVSVWGDAGWSMLAGTGVRHRGYAGHRHELTRIYAGTAINIDIGRLYQSDIVPLRVFEVLACGAFLIAEHADDLDALFDVGRELETYRELAELVDKVAHYVARPELRATIAARGRAAVAERHSVRARVQVMLRTLPALRAR
jgi:hypothetical protein